MAREGRRVPTWRRHVSPSPPPPEPQSFATPLFRHRPSPTSSPKGEQKWQDSANPAEGEEDQHQDHVQEEPKKPFLDENDERKRVSAHLIYSRTGAEELELKKLSPEKAAAAGNDVFGVGLTFAENLTTGWLYVACIAPESPAASSQILVMDELIAVDGVAMNPDTNYRMIAKAVHDDTVLAVLTKKILGPFGSRVVLAMQRRLACGKYQIFDADLLRSRIQNNSNPEPEISAKGAMPISFQGHLKSEPEKPHVPSDFNMVSRRMVLATKLFDDDDAALRAALRLLLRDKGILILSRIRKRFLLIPDCAKERAFNRWKHHIDRQHQARATTEKFIQRMVNLSQFLLRFVHIWRTLSSKKRLNNTKLYQALLHRQRKILFESFFNWSSREGAEKESTAATANAVEQRRLTHAAGKIIMAMIRWQNYSVLSATFTSWRTVVVRNDSMERLTQKLVNRWKTMVLSGCMNRWHEVCRLLDTMDRMAMRIRKEKMHKGWSRWLSHRLRCRRQKRCRSLLEMTARRMRSSGLFKALSIWNSYVSARKRLVESAWRVIQLLYVPFTSWRTVLGRNVCVARLAKKVMNRFKWLSVFKLFARWYGSVAHHKRVAWAARKAFKKRETVVLSGCMNRWHEVCRLLDTMDRMAMRIRKEKMHKGWSRWLSHRLRYRRQKRCRSLLEMTARKMRSSGLFKALSIWNAYVSARKRLVESAWRVIQRRKIGVMVRSFDEWCLACASDEKNPAQHVVSLTLPDEFKHLNHSEESTMAFDLALQNQICTALDISADNVRVMCHQRGSVKIQVLLSDVCKHDGVFLSAKRLSNELTKVCMQKNGPFTSCGLKLAACACETLGKISKNVADMVHAAIQDEQELLTRKLTNMEARCCNALNNIDMELQQQLLLNQHLEKQLQELQTEREVLEETNTELTKELSRSGVALDNIKLLTVELDRDYDAWDHSDSQMLESTLAESADLAREDVKVLELQNGSVIASTIVVAKDWSAVSSKLEASIKDDSGSLKAMGVVGCAGLMGGIIGKAPQCACIKELKLLNACTLFELDTSRDNAKELTAERDALCQELYLMDEHNYAMTKYMGEAGVRLEESIQNNLRKESCIKALIDLNKEMKSVVDAQKQEIEVALAAAHQDNMDKVERIKGLDTSILVAGATLAQVAPASGDKAHNHGCAMTNEENFMLIQAVQSEKEMRVEQAQRIIKRLLIGQLAGAFDTYHSRVFEAKRKRETCKRVVFRTRQCALAGAFDTFVVAVMQLKAHLETVTTATKRWRAPMLGRSFDAWCKYVEAQENMSKQFDLRQLNNFELELLSAAETVQNLQSELTLQKELNQHLEEQLQELKTEREVLEEAKDGLTKELNAARSVDGEDKRALAAAVVAEKKRRIQQAERTVKFILQSQLAGAFGTYHDRVVETKRKRETCRRRVLRIHEMGLGFAFDLFAGMVRELKAHRLTVDRAVSRWRRSLLQIGFDSWLDCMDVTRSEVLEAACTQLTTEREVLEQQAAIAGSNDDDLKNLREQLMLIREERDKLFNEEAGKLAAAQSELEANKSRCIYLQGALNDVNEEFDALRDELTKELNAARSVDGEDKRALAAAVVAEKKRRIQQAERTVKFILQSQLAGAFGAYHDRVVETKRKRETCRRRVLRMHEMGLGFAFDLFAGMVRELKAHRLTVDRAVSRWRRSLLQIGFDSWLDCMDVTRSEVLEAACTQLTTEREVFEAAKDDSTTCYYDTLKDNPVFRCNLGCGFVGTVAFVTAHEQTCTQRWREREQEAKPEDAEKTREQLEAQLRKTSGDLQAMAAAQLQVGQLQQQLIEEAKKGKGLLDQFQMIESKLADTQNQHEEYLKFTERQFRQLQQQLADKGNALRDELEKMEAKLADTEKNHERFAAQLQKVGQLQQQLPEELNNSNAPLDHMKKMDHWKDFEEALIQERTKNDVMIQRIYQLETFIYDILVQQQQQDKLTKELNAARSVDGEDKRALAAAVVAEKKRRIQQAERTVKFILQSQLAGAFGAYHDRVVETKRKRETCRRRVLRMHEMGLGFAFDLFAGMVRELKAHRLTVDRAVSRWRRSLLQIGFDSWLDCMDVTRSEVLEAACTQLTTEREVLEQQAAIAGSNDDDLKNLREQLMLIREERDKLFNEEAGKLAAAQSELEANKSRCIYLQGALNDVNEEFDALRDELTKELNAARSVDGEDKRALAAAVVAEKKRRIQQAERTVKFILQSQLAGAFGAYHDRVVETKRKRETCRRRVLRMHEMGLGFAFDLFAGMVRELKAHRLTVDRAVSRWRRSLLQIGFDSWLDCMDVTRSEVLEAACTQLTTEHEVFVATKDDFTTCHYHTLKDNPVFRCNLGCGFVGTVAFVTAHEQTCTQRWREREQEAKPEDAEKTREQLEAQLRKTSGDLQAMAAAQLQVGQLQQQLIEEAKKGKSLLDQFQMIESKLAETQNQHEEYLKFTERQFRQLQQQLADKGNALRDELEKMEAKLADTEKNHERFAAQLQKVGQPQQQLPEELNKSNAPLDHMKKMDHWKDFEEALIQERTKNDVMIQRIYQLETFISDILVQQQQQDKLTKELNAARSVDGEDKRALAAAVVAEKKRRIQQAERTVKFILQSQLAGAFGAYHDRVVETKRKRETCRRRVLRMHEMGLGFAFDLFAGMVRELKAHRLTVDRAVSRWRRSLLQIGFDSWLDCMDVTRSEVLEAACTQLTTEHEVFEGTKDDSTTYHYHTLKDNPVFRCNLGCGFVGTVAFVTAHEQTCTQSWREREQEAKPEDADKTREQLEAQLRKTSGDLQAMAAAQLQVGQLQQQLMKEAKIDNGHLQQLQLTRAVIEFEKCKTHLIWKTACVKGIQGYITRQLQIICSFAFKCWRQSVKTVKRKARSFVTRRIKTHATSFIARWFQQLCLSRKILKFIVRWSSHLISRCFHKLKRHVMWRSRQRTALPRILFRIEFCKIRAAFAKWFEYVIDASKHRATMHRLLLLHKEERTRTEEREELVNKHIAKRLHDYKLTSFLTWHVSRIENVAARSC